jgi:hypothetical protein
MSDAPPEPQAAPEPPEGRAIEDIVITALLEAAQEQLRVLHERQLAQAAEIDRHLAAHLRMMTRLANTTREAMCEIEGRLAALEARRPPGEG